MLNSWKCPASLAVLATFAALASSCSNEKTASEGDAASAQDADPTAPDAAAAASDAAPGAADAATVTSCTADAIELITLINDYRAENALPAIAASPSLCIVGDTHIGDLVANAPHTVGSCNLHSWSDQGAWSACCYTPDHAQAQCMWDKPSQLTAYPSAGYENSAGGGGSISPAQALSQWKNSAAHNAVILNEGIWANQTWRAVGVGIRDGYAMLWFGTSIDPAN